MSSASSSSAKHQVLILLPNNSSSDSPTWLIRSLKSILTPYYTVQTLTKQITLTEPWELGCALLVLPSRQEMEVLGEWNWKMTEKVDGYLRNGGKVWRVAMQEEMVAISDDGLARSENGIVNWTNGKEVVEIKLGSKVVSTLKPESGREEIAVLRQSESSSTSSMILAYHQHLEKGLQFVIHSQLFNSIPNQPSLSSIITTSLQVIQFHLHNDESQTKTNHFIQIDSNLLKPKHPLPQFLQIHPELHTNSDQVLYVSGMKPFLKPMENVQEGWELKDRNDTIRFIPINDTNIPSHLESCRTTPPSSTTDENLKPILIPSLLPSTYSHDDRRSWTPLFDFPLYWKTLDLARRRLGIKRKHTGGTEAGAGTGRLGEVMFYGEAVTSTQTLFDKNPILLHNLPTPFLSMASFQLSGRGRGTNQWLSPPGCLQFSILLNLPSTFPSSKIVFVQYLMALAACEGLDENGKLGMRIKWPNDIYAEAEGIGGSSSQSPTTMKGIERNKKGRAKLGGILVNSSFQNGEWRLVVGCGINILNDLPTTSLAQLHSLSHKRKFGNGGNVESSEMAAENKVTMEESLAKILVAFDGIWERFLEDEGFDGLMDEYLGRWLHTDQEVLLATVEPNLRLRIESITPDAGFLRCVKLGTVKSPNAQGISSDSGMDRVSGNMNHLNLGGGRNQTPTKTEYIDLQPDGNSFDLMTGLIRRKA